MKEIIKRNDIADIVRKKITENDYKKTDIAKQSGLSRNTVYKIIQSGGRFEDYSVDNFLKMCKQINLKVYVE